MKKALLFSLLIALAFIQTQAQSWRQMMDSLNRISQQDHQLMLEMLGIDELRPGPSGNPESPNAANTNEDLASPFENLPDPLVFNKGKKVKNSAQWAKRRLEIMEDFDREIYGRVPDETPDVSWVVVSAKDTMEGSYPVIIKELIGYVDNSAYTEISVEIEMTLTIPAHADGPVPVIVEYGFNFPGSWKPPRPSGPTWQELLLEKGWGSAKLIPSSIQADNGAGLREGIIGLVNRGEPRKLDDWGSLRAWAWGASRALDYFETDEDVDQHRVGIEGLSRYGKAAIVAMAYEPRLAVGFIGSSGAGGAKILRRVFGEQVENLASSGEYHWFAPNFIKYAGPLTPNDLPVDAHQLVALCAPRPVFISVGSPTVEGQWIDAKGMFLAGVHAGPVYQMLGKKGLAVSEFPPQETSLIEGDIAFRQHEGGHTVGPNWPFFIEFAERYFSETK